MMNERGKSDSPVVPGKPPNKGSSGQGLVYGDPYAGTKAETPDTAKGKPTGRAKAGPEPAEGVEGRGLAKGNPQPRNTLRTQGRERVQQALARVRQAAVRDKGMRFTALLHHVYNPDTLREAYFRLKPDAAPGVDGETWRHYGEDLEGSLLDLSERLKRGAYRAKPVRRAYIAKADGRQRPLGVPALEDKIVQRATVMVLNAVYETDFLGFSYGFRPGRSQHNALDALYVGFLTRKVNWGACRTGNNAPSRQWRRERIYRDDAFDACRGSRLDADIRGFFDTINHERRVAADIHAKEGQ